MVILQLSRTSSVCGPRSPADWVISSTPSKCLRPVLMAIFTNCATSEFCKYFHSSSMAILAELRSGAVREYGHFGVLQVFPQLVDGDQFENAGQGRICYYALDTVEEPVKQRLHDIGMFFHTLHIENNELRKGERVCWVVEESPIGTAFDPLAQSWLQMRRKQRVKRAQPEQRTAGVLLMHTVDKLRELVLLKVRPGIVCAHQKLQEIQQKLAVIRCVR